MSEAKLRKEIIKYIKKSGYHCRHHTQSITEERGLPDVYACIEGLYIELELKIGNAYKQTAIQKYQQNICEQGGGLYFVIKSIEELKIIIKEARRWKLNIKQNPLNIKERVMKSLKST